MEYDKVFIGIDPGKEGAVAFIYPSGEIETKTFPLIAGEYDIREFQNMFKFMSKLNCHLTIEDVKALQKPFDSGNWNLSRGKTIIECLSIFYNIPHTLVHSKTWQKEMWQGIPEMRGPSKRRESKDGKVTVVKGPVLTKEMSLLAAKRLYPCAELRDPDRKTERTKSPHSGVVDSILIAGYGSRRFK